MSQNDFSWHPGYIVSISSLGWSIIPVACKHCIRRAIKEWCSPICPATILLPNPPYCMPTAPNVPAKVNFRLQAMETIYTKNSTTSKPQLANIHCVIRYDTNCKPFLIKHDFIDQWRVRHLFKAYVYNLDILYSNHIFKKLI